MVSFASHLASIFFQLLEVARDCIFLFSMGIWLVEPFPGFNTTRPSKGSFANSELPTPIPHAGLAYTDDLHPFGPLKTWSNRLFRRAPVRRLLSRFPRLHVVAAVGGSDVAFLLSWFFLRVINPFLSREPPPSIGACHGIRLPWWHPPCFVMASIASKVPISRSVGDCGRPANSPVSPWLLCMVVSAGNTFLGSQILRTAYFIWRHEGTWEPWTHRWRVPRDLLVY